MELDDRVGTAALVQLVPPSRSVAGEDGADGDTGGGVSRRDRRCPSRTSGGGRRRAWLGVAVLVGGSVVALWLLVWARTGEMNAWPQLQDDSFYYFRVATNIATGHGFTIDSINTTNGFHPLWMMVCVAVFGVFGRSYAALAVINVIDMALFGITAGVMFSILRRRVPVLPAALAVALLWFTHYVHMLLAGLEGGLATLLLALLAMRLITSGDLVDGHRERAPAVTGVLLGLLFLARLDSVFYGLPLMLVLLRVGWRGSTGGATLRARAGIARAFSTLWPVGVLVGPYLVVNQLTMGRLVPISGVLKSSFPQLAMSTSYIRDYPEYPALICLGALGWLLSFRSGHDVRWSRTLGILTIGAALHLANTVLFMNWGVLHWHFVTYLVPGIMGAAVLAEEIVARLRFAARAVAVATFASVLIVLLVRSVSVWDLGFVWPARDAAVYANTHLPNDAIFGMKDSGAFSYFANRPTVNLDGVINSFGYQKALCRGDVKSFLLSEGVTYIVQHRVEGPAVERAYETYRQEYPCHLRGGRDSAIEFRATDEVYRSRIYSEQAGPPTRLLIWRLH
jgi:hypothetical protein